MKNKNTKFVICFFQSLNGVGYNYKNVPFETTRLIEFLPDGFEHIQFVFFVPFRNPRCWRYQGCLTLELL